MVQGGVHILMANPLNGFLIFSAGFHTAGCVQHGLGPSEGQRSAGSAQLLHTYRGRRAVC